MYSGSLDIVMSKPKEKLLTVRAHPDIIREFKMAAALRGASMSGLIYQFVVRTIREEKQKTPEAFSSDASASVDELENDRLTRIIDNWSRLTDQKAKQDMLEMFEIIQNENKQTNRRERGTKRA